MYKLFSYLIIVLIALTGLSCAFATCDAENVTVDEGIDDAIIIDLNQNNNISENSNLNTNITKNVVKDDMNNNTRLPADLNADITKNVVKDYLDYVKIIRPNPYIYETPFNRGNVNIDIVSSTTLSIFDGSLFPPVIIYQ